jgi:hypothetical protein
MPQLHMFIDVLVPVDEAVPGCVVGLLENDP